MIRPFRYRGEYYDLSSGTYYLCARYYDPAIGRFLRENTYHGKANALLATAYRR
jgi:RHS repeat-associated protein